ncbi:MAG: gliding motility-associated ABC transporter ATP-binding subunit GldA [Bacteroidetes bacterium]|nr:MAG: gliding motility-associated ABC transporter ATP-binding subunit GldA [Bacteroidota bacterium]REK03539.1 MAG: gliding motility-associated ABC transporter ATP-binding subunit GldA [Bacteroidota bacterium]REK51213.1 MAG: gliding motility-associated ABC transporter ATP-binding subunit GldA [Bacteroidota bacterium]
MSVRVNNVTKFYGEQRALDGVSFDAGKGGVTGFLGPNGAGKSTMMKIITGFISRNAGVVEVCGLNVEEHPVEVKRKIGYLPENNPLYLDMYVREYLEFVAALYRVPGNLKDRAEEMISVTGLGLEKKKKIGALSKGYRQRVGLAQAIIHDPEVLILDEPTSGLDPNQLSEIRELIRNLGKDKTVIFSTHIMQEVEAICEKVIIINRGKIVADESTSVLRSSASGKTIIRVEFSSQIRKSDLLQIKKISSAESEDGLHWNIISDSDKDIREDVFRFAVSKDVTVLSMQKQERKLEDVFRQLTKQATT